MLTHYILSGKEPVEADKEAWAKWRETADRHVARTDIAPGLWVSTLFTGLALKHDPTTLFETVIAGPERGQKVGQYATWSEAEAGHRQFVEDVRLVTAKQ